jgi:hypothetical protein
VGLRNDYQRLFAYLITPIVIYYAVAVALIPLHEQVHVWICRTYDVKVEEVVWFKIWMRGDLPLPEIGGYVRPESLEDWNCLYANLWWDGFYNALMWGFFAVDCTWTFHRFKVAFTS